MSETIYYSGVGAKKSGKHTMQEFLKIMNKNFNVECSAFLPEQDYKPCTEYKEMNRKAMEYNIKHKKPTFTYNRSKKMNAKYKRLLNKCNKYRKTVKKRKCNVDEYIEFSGAEKR